MHKIQISPSIIAADFSNLKQEIYDIEKAGADSIHIDIMDGHFVPNISIGPQIVKDIKKNTSLPLDIHLMTNNPINYIYTFSKLNVNTIIIHPETTQQLDYTIKKIHSFEIYAGIALNPATSEHVLQYIANQIHMILIMTVNPGWIKQKFISYPLNKILNIKNILIKNNNDNCLINVDGGITINNAKNIIQKQVDILTIGSGIYHNKNYVDIIKKLKNIKL